jgi:hypothetical protein
MSYKENNMLKNRENPSDRNAEGGYHQGGRSAELAAKLLSTNFKNQNPPPPVKRTYTKVELAPQGIPFHNWDVEPTVECHLETIDYKLNNGDVVNKVTRVDNGQEELIGRNVKLQQYFDELGVGYYVITRLDRVKSKNTGRSYYDYEVEYSVD